MSKEKKEEYAVIVISDTHINSTQAVCPRSINLNEGGTYRPSTMQHALRRNLEDFVDKAEAVTKGYKRVVVLNGDIGEMDSKDRSSEVITRNKATILKMMSKTLDPLINIADALIVIRGTAAHTGKSSWLEEAFARDYESIVIPEDDDVFSHYHFRGVIGGVKFDIAHHARMGGMRHTHKGYAIRLAQDTMDKYRDKGLKPPDVVIRSHNHRRADSGYNWPTFATYTPCWQGHTEFVHRIGSENDAPSIGGDIFLCHKARKVRDDGYFASHKNFVWYPFDYELKPYSKSWRPIKL